MSSGEWQQDVSTKQKWLSLSLTTASRTHLDLQHMIRRHHPHYALTPHRQQVAIHLPCPIAIASATATGQLVARQLDSSASNPIGIFMRDGIQASGTSRRYPLVTARLGRCDGSGSSLRYDVPGRPACVSNDTRPGSHRQTLGVWTRLVPAAHSAFQLSKLKLRCVLLAEIKSPVLG